MGDFCHLALVREPIVVAVKNNVVPIVVYKKLVRRTYAYNRSSRLLFFPPTKHAPPTSGYETAEITQNLADFRRISGLGDTAPRMGRAALLTRLPRRISVVAGSRGVIQHQSTGHSHGTAHRVAIQTTTGMPIGGRATRSSRFDRK